MLNIPETVKALYKRDGVYKNFRCHFPDGELPDITNDNIVQESVQFTESICSQDVFKFGLAEASVIEFETVGVANMYGMTIECSSEIDCSSLSSAEKADIAAGTWDGTWDSENEVFSVPYGTFRVEECPRDHQAMTHRRVTGFTTTFPDKGWIPQFPKVMTCQSFTMDMKALVPVFINQALPRLDRVTLGSNHLYGASPGVFYDSFGNEHTIEIGVGSSLDSDLRFLTFTNVYDGVRASYFKCAPIYSSLEEYKDQYYSFGVAVSALTTGYDLTCAKDGRKVYKNNLEALKQVMPYIFAPSAIYIPIGSDGTMYVQQELNCIYNEWKLTPIIQTNDVAAQTAFLANDSKRIKMRCGLCYLYGGQQYRIKIDGGTSLSVDATVPYSGFLVADLYGLPEYLDRFKVECTDDGRTVNVQTAFTNFKYKVYGYANALSIADTLNSELEFQAAFAKPDRKGVYSLLRISNSSPEAVTPSDYSQMWFDEYDIESIGTIRYAYTDDADEEQVVDCKFGPGASTYDMSDNIVLKALSGARPATIEAMLYRDFIPYLGGVNFTPIDLNMKGLPYLEAGDAITVTAQDGTVCSSYVLRQTQTGVQALRSQVDSQSGLIIDSEEA